MNEPNPDVPADIEAVLVGNNAAAGGLGGGLGRSSAGGAKGAAWAARRMRTVVEQRQVRIPAIAAEVIVNGARAGFKKTLDFPGFPNRFLVALGWTGLQKVVVELFIQPAGPSVDVTVRAYVKQGLIHRHPARRVADKIATALTTERLPPVPGSSANRG